MKASCPCTPQIWSKSWTVQIRSIHQQTQRSQVSRHITIYPIGKWVVSNDFLQLSLHLLAFISQPTSFHNAQVHSFGFAGPVLRGRSFVVPMCDMGFLLLLHLLRHWENDTIIELKESAGPGKDCFYLERIVHNPWFSFRILSFNSKKYQENCWTWAVKHHLIHMKFHYTTKCRRQNHTELSYKNLSTYLSCWHVATLVLVIVACSWPSHRDSSGTNQGLCYWAWHHKCCA